MSAMLILSALLMGLLGSTHCVVMCGGVVAMTCSALPLARRAGILAHLPYVLAYNAGRITSYALAGALAGALGALAGSFDAVSQAMLGLRFAAGFLMIAVGFYLAGWGGALRWMERVGEPAWRRIAPLARKLVPVRTPGQALALGLVWGWMPCGLVYAAVAASLTSGSLLGGAATMAAFGLGTLPMLVAMGSAAALMTRVARSRGMRTAAAVIVVTFGVVQITLAGRAWAAGSRGKPPTCCAHHGPAAQTHLLPTVSIFAP
jgi:sulfite exporter TauE/SafE